MIIKHRISSLLLILVIGFSCKNVTSQSANTTKETATETPKSVTTNATGPYLTYKMDGIPVKAIFPGINILFVPAKKEATIWGKTPTGLISIILDDVETTGTYTIKGNSKNGAGVMSGSNMFEVKKQGTPFTVTIETIDAITAIKTADAKAIRGSFQGKLIGDDGKMVEITEGKFSTQ